FFHVRRGGNYHHACLHRLSNMSKYIKVSTVGESLFAKDDRKCRVRQKTSSLLQTRARDCFARPLAHCVSHGLVINFSASDEVPPGRRGIHPLPPTRIVDTYEQQVCFWPARKTDAENRIARSARA